MLRKVFFLWFFVGFKSKIEKLRSRYGGHLGGRFQRCCNAILPSVVVVMVMVMVVMVMVMVMLTLMLTP